MGGAAGLFYDEKCEGGGQVTLCNCAIIRGVVSNSPLLSAPAEAVEAIHGVMPPVLFQGLSWASVDHVAS